MSRRTKSYLAELKYQAVGDYLSGKGSLREICRKYKIRSTRQLRNWIKLYNGHKELKWQTEQAPLAGKEKQEVPVGELPAVHIVIVCGFWQSASGRAHPVFVISHNAI